MLLYLKLVVTLLLGVLSTAISWDNSVGLRFSPYVVISLFEVQLCVCVLCFMLVSYHCGFSGLAFSVGCTLVFVALSVSSFGVGFPIFENFSCIFLFFSFFQIRKIFHKRTEVRDRTYWGYKIAIAIMAGHIKNKISLSECRTLFQ